MNDLQLSPVTRHVNAETAELANTWICSACSARSALYVSQFRAALSHNSSHVVHRDDDEDRGGFDARDREDVAVGLPMRQAGDRKQRDDSAVVRQAVHAAGGHRGDSVKDLE